MSGLQRTSAQGQNPARAGSARAESAIVPPWGGAGGSFHCLITFLLFNWASLVAQLVKDLPAMLETWVQSLGWEDLLEKGMATHSSILGLPWWLSW